LSSHLYFIIFFVETNLIPIHIPILTVWSGAVLGGSGWRLCRPKRVRRIVFLQPPGVPLILRVIVQRSSPLEHFTFAPLWRGSEQTVAFSRYRTVACRGRLDRSRAMCGSRSHGRRIRLSSPRRPFRKSANTSFSIRIVPL